MTRDTVSNLLIIANAHQHKAPGTKKSMRVFYPVATAGLQSAHNCMLPEIYIRLLAPHKNKHPLWLLILQIGTGAFPILQQKI